MYNNKISYEEDIIRKLVYEDIEYSKANAVSNLSNSFQGLYAAFKKNDPVRWAILGDALLKKGIPVLFEADCCGEMRSVKQDEDLRFTFLELWGSSTGDVHFKENRREYDKHFNKMWQSLVQLNFIPY